MSLEICKTCGLPQELCVCSNISKEEQTNIKIYLERRKWGKHVTIIQGIDSKTVDVSKLTKKLKSKLATGGTVKNETGLIILQGDHAWTVKDILVKEGFDEAQIEVSAS